MKPKNNNSCLLSSVIMLYKIKSIYSNVLNFNINNIILLWCLIEFNQNSK